MPIVPLLQGVGDHLKCSAEVLRLIGLCLEESELERQ